MELTFLGAAGTVTGSKYLSVNIIRTSRKTNQESHAWKWRATA